MSVFILDTSILSLLQRNQPNVLAQLIRHVSETICITTVTIEESWAGCISLLRKTKTNRERAFASQFFADVVNHLSNFQVVSANESALNLFDRLARLKLNVGSNDLRIAVIALEINATVVTVNVRDFSRVPGLNWVDWSA